MFCRISADRAQGGAIRYYPFRLTPYQLTIRDSDAAEPQPCCLLISERVHSGYEGTRHHTASLLCVSSEGREDALLCLSREEKKSSETASGRVLFG